MIGAAHWPSQGPAINAYKPAAATVTRKPKERPVNTGSKLLTRPENELMFEVLGSERVSLVAGVVQLLKAAHGHWQHVDVGVVSLVKDYQRKVYVLTLFEIYNGKQLWEQVL